MASRTPEEIRASIQRNREALAVSVVELRGEVAEFTDWRKQLRENQKPLMIGAAAASFVLSGGLAGLTGVLTFRRRRHRRRAA
jgi:hypothetical protein